MDNEESKKEILVPIIRPTASIPFGEELSLIMDTDDEEKLGMFTGVYLPTCEFMWSVLLFVRFSSITGEAGILLTCAVILLCAGTMVITATSLSAIATNGIVSGGVYQIITKSLGRGVGGSIALIYYLGVTVLVAVEIVGSVNGFLDVTKLKIVSNEFWNQYIWSLLCFCLCSMIVLSGKNIFHGIALFLGFVLVLSFLSMYAGLIIPRKDFSGPNLGYAVQNLGPTDRFKLSNTVAFILPCFIGLFSGVNNARFLRDPNRSIPVGTFAAISTSSFLYILLICLFGSSVNRMRLLDDIMVGPELSFPTKWISVPGVLLVGIGASLQCLNMASSVLYSLVHDDLLPFLKQHTPLGKQWHGEPKPALIATCFIVIPLMLSNVEVLAEITTMFFLLCYGSTNFVCFLLSSFKSPNWRPVFEFHSSQLSAFGFLLCISLMFAIQWYTALISIITAASVAYLFQTSSSSLSWGQGMHGLIFHIMLNYLVAVERLELKRKIHLFLEDSIDMQRQTFGICSDIPVESIDRILPTKWANRVWRPQMIVFLKMIGTMKITDSPLLSLISQLRSRSALCVIVNVVAKDEELDNIDSVARERKQEYDDYLSVTKEERMELIDEILIERKLILCQAMEGHNILGFAKVLSAPTVRIGQRIFLQTMGLGELTPNTLVLAWPDDYHGRNRRRTAFAHMEEMWYMSKRLGLSSLMVKNVSKFPLNKQILVGFIDVWWIVEQGQLLLMIAYLLRQHKVWQNCRVRLFTICHILDDADEMKQELMIYLTMLRISVDDLIFIPLDIVDSSELPETVSKPMGGRRDTFVASKVEHEFRKRLNSYSHHRSHERHASESSSSHHSRSESVTIVSSLFFRELRNEMIRYSANAQLVLLNLPPPNTASAPSATVSCITFSQLRIKILDMDLVEWLTEEFHRCMLVYASDEMSTAKFPIST